ncbi:hypothetical protein [Nocardia sp. CA-135398]|uniref:hypothetical protein n=1 Tax=Nocardia sp. CA-135398 TaxID=3239977 RepID=UPI003D994413
MIADSNTTPTEVSVNSQVTATGDARVEQQVGTQFVDSVLHNSMFYTTLPGDPPERQHEVAKAHLKGDNPRRAEEFLGSLLANGHTTTERAYQYVLSVLSDRSFTEITAELSNEIHNAMRAASELPRDEWRDALDVVDTLLRYAHTEFGDGTAARELTAALEVFGMLTVDRQDEIDRHLNLILSGAVQERLTGERKYQVAVKRMSGNRVERAWKFFEAHPRQPMKWLTSATRSTATDWRDAVLGSMATALAIVCALVDAINASTVVGLGVITAGGYMMLRYTTVLQTDVRHAESVWANFQPPLPYQQETKFDKLVDQCFREVTPGGLWETTAGYRAHLKRRLQQQYSDDEVHPSELKWLIMWHGVRARRQCDYPPVQPAGSQRASNLRIIGVMVWATGLAPLAVSHFVAFLLAAGGWWGIRGVACIVSVSRTQSLLDHDAEVLLAEESAQYHRWVQVLADRPNDAEMAHWLALDKAYLKDDALRRANLRERDLVTHVVLTERAPYARKGRVTDGPPRYEAYLVNVFLLTAYGMRTTRTYLSLATGDVRNEQRQMCTYDAVASASVMEKGVRTFLADGRPSVDNLSERMFRLTLLNGTCIAEVKENPRATGDDQTTGEDDRAGDAAYVQTSGFDSALQILEAVATEGRNWIARDRERKQRWARNWCTRSSSGDKKGAGKNSGRTILR